MSERPQPLRRRERSGSRYDSYVDSMRKGATVFFADKATANRVKRYAESLGCECILERDKTNYILKLK